jgi:diacylglycerol kinase (ATP)
VGAGARVTARPVPRSRLVTPAGAAAVNLIRGQFSLPQAAPVESSARNSAAIIINPIAGGWASPEATRRRAALAIEIAERFGLEPEVLVTEHKGHARELACAAVARGIPLIAAWGGDGTVNEIASAVAFTDATLAIVPSGSGNGLALELGISRRPAAALATALSGQTRRIDVGELGGHLFVNLAGVGFDAHIAKQFETRHRRRGLLSYAHLTLKHLWTYRALSYEIPIRQERFETDALLVVIANSRQFGNGAIIAPDAVLDDGLLDLVIVAARPPARALAELPRLFRGHVDTVRGVTLRTVTEATVTAAQRTLFHVDGEPLLADPPLVARVHRQVLRVRVPARK